MVKTAWASQIKCAECPYMAEELIVHPYGEGQASEMLINCSLGQSKTDKPEDCAGYAIELETMIDAEEAAKYENERKHL